MSWFDREPGDPIDRAPERSLFDTVEFQAVPGSRAFFLDLASKDRWWTNSVTPRRLRKGDEMRVQALRITIPQRIPADQVADIFHAARVEFRINGRPVVDAPIDQFDTVQIIPDDYHLPHLDDPETIRALEVLAGQKFPQIEWPPSNGVNRATIRVTGKPVITSEHDIEATIDFGTRGCPHPCLIRVALVGPYLAPITC